MYTIFYDIVIINLVMVPYLKILYVDTYITHYHTKFLSCISKIKKKNHFRIGKLKQKNKINKEAKPSKAMVLILHKLIFFNQDLKKEISK